MAAAVPDCESSLQNIIDQTSLKWVFVGGKGGVGKTTISCSLAIQLSRVRESVLLISTDPAHSLSDAFGQKFQKEELVEGFTNLYAMELKLPDRDFRSEEEMPENPTAEDHLKKLFVEACPRMEGFPGIDEFISMQVFWRFIESKEYSVVVFDTAPTGHAIRFIGLPFLFDKLFDKMRHLMPIFRLLVAAMRKLNGDRNSASEAVPERFIGDIAAHLRNPALTTFVGVCTAEFLPLYETERLIQRLTAYGIDTHNLVVNQLYSCRPDDQSKSRCCRRCQTRRTMQEKYLAEIDSLYQGVHVTKLPLMEEEVRGVDMLEPFSLLLLHPYTP